jgi:hypothetical protein
VFCLICRSVAADIHGGVIYELPSVEVTKNKTDEVALAPAESNSLSKIQVAKIRQLNFQNHPKP